MTAALTVLAMLAARLRGAGDDDNSPSTLQRALATLRMTAAIIESVAGDPASLRMPPIGEPR